MLTPRRSGSADAPLEPSTPTDTPRLATGTEQDFERIEVEADYDRFGPYRVFECLGAGGMASVHRATLEVGGVMRDIALKRLLPQLADDTRFVADFIREAKLAAQLHHPNIARTLELGRIGRTYYIAMELVRGTSLWSLIKNASGQPVPIGVAVSLMIELCDVLDYVGNFVDHGAPSSIVHRDLSPSNLLVDEDGHIKVIDFGVAKTLSGRFTTNTGLVKGKLGYLAPEAIGGEPLDPRADVYSAGVVMWEMLAGCRLFGGRDETAVIERIRNGVTPRPSTKNPRIPRELDDLVMSAIARVPARRSSPAALREQLERVRRRCGDATPLDVASWKHELRVPRPREDSVTPLSVEDLEELLDEAELGETTHAGRFEDEDTMAEVDIRIYFNHQDDDPK